MFSTGNYHEDRFSRLCLVAIQLGLQVQVGSDVSAVRQDVRAVKQDVSEFKERMHRYEVSRQINHT